MSGPDQFTERTPAIEITKKITERAGKDSFDCGNDVAARNQVTQGGKNRQTRADVGFVEEILLALPQQIHESRIFGPRQNIRALVRRNNVQVRFHKLRVSLD